MEVTAPYFVLSLTALRLNDKLLHPREIVIRMLEETPGLEETPPVAEARGPFTTHSVSSKEQCDLN